MAASTPTPSLHSEILPGGTVHALLLVFSFLLLARPEDFIKALGSLHLAMIVGLSAIALFGFGVLAGGLKLRIHTETKLMAALTVWFVLGVSTAFWRSNTVGILTDTWIKTIIIFFLLSQTLTSLTRLRQLLWVIVLSGLVAGGMPLVLGGGRLAEAAEEGQRAFSGVHGFFGGNYIGIGASIVLPYIGAMMLYTRALWKIGLLMASFGTLLVLTVLSGSRSSILSIIISLCLLWVTLLRHSMKTRLLGFLLAAGLVGALAFAPGVLWSRLSAMWDPNAMATSAVTRSAEESQLQRQELLRDSIKYTLQHPIFGLGLGNFQIAHGTLTGNAQEWKSTHNTFTQISSESGIPGFVLFVSLLSVVLRRMRQVSRDCFPHSSLAPLRSLAQATVISIIAFCLGGLFAHLAYDYYLYYLAAIGVGVQNVASRELAVLRQDSPEAEQASFRRQGRQ